MQLTQQNQKVHWVSRSNSPNPQSIMCYGFVGEVARPRFTIKYERQHSVFLLTDNTNDDWYRFNTLSEAKNKGILLWRLFCRRLWATKIIHENGIKIILDEATSQYKIKYGNIVWKNYKTKELAEAQVIKTIRKSKFVL